MVAIGVCLCLVLLSVALLVFAMALDALAEAWRSIKKLR